MIHTNRSGLCSFHPSPRYFGELGLFSVVLSCPNWSLKVLWALSRQIISHVLLEWMADQGVDVVRRCLVDAGLAIPATSCEATAPSDVEDADFGMVVIAAVDNAGRSGNTTEGGWRVQ